MKRFLIRAVLALAVVAGCLLCVPPLAAQDLPAADDILDREARLSVLPNVKTMVMRGKVSVQGMKGRFARYLAAPNRLYDEFEIDGLMKAESGVSGGIAWESSSLTGSRLVTGGEKAKAIREADVERGANWRKHYLKVKTVCEEKVEGRLAWKVHLTTQGGELVIAHYDKQSGLQVREELTMESPQGKLTLVTYFSDHRRVDGVLLPFAMRVVAGPAELLITVDRIEHNANVAEERFAVPPDVARLADRQQER